MTTRNHSQDLADSFLLPPVPLMTIQFPLLAIALFMMGALPILQAAPLYDSAEEIITSDDYGAFLNALEAQRTSEFREIEPAKN
jgi:hypothetical protein